MLTPVQSSQQSSAPVFSFFIAPYLFPDGDAAGDEPRIHARQNNRYDGITIHIPFACCT